MGAFQVPPEDDDDVFLTREQFIQLYKTLELATSYTSREGGVQLILMEIDAWDIIQDVQEEQDVEIPEDFDYPDVSDIPGLDPAEARRLRGRTDGS